MKNLKFITIATILSFTVSQIINAQNGNVPKYIDIIPEEGILLYENGDTGVIDYHSNGMDMNDYNYLVLRATNNDSLPNNVIITASGTMSIGSIEVEDTYKLLDGDTTLTTNPKLIVQNGYAIGSEWNIFSDQRLKKDIKSYEQGLTTLNKLNFYEYEYNGLAGTQAGKKHVGIMAQEIKEVLPHTVSTFRSKLRKEDSKGSTLYAFNPTELIYLAINGIKELDEKIKVVEELEEKVEALEIETQEFETLQNKYNDLEDELNTIKEYLGLTSMAEILPKNNLKLLNERSNKTTISQQSYLEQCIPNPSQGSTNIAYKISQKYNTAKMIFSNLQGQIVDVFPIREVGAGSITWQPHNLPKCVYTYSLIVDDQIVDTKRVILK